MNFFLLILLIGFFVWIVTLTYWFNPSLKIKEDKNGQSKSN